MSVSSATMRTSRDLLRNNSERCCPLRYASMRQSDHVVEITRPKTNSSYSLATSPHLAPRVARPLLPTSATRRCARSI